MPGSSATVEGMASISETKRVTQAPAEQRTGARRRGRPTAAQQTQLTRADVVARGLVCARETSLADITISALARDLDVTPGLIHYLIPGKDGLITGVMNAFYSELCRDWPAPKGHWRDHMVAMAMHLRTFYLRYRGIVLYTGAHNKYRVVQAVEAEETDYGLVFLDALFRGVMMMKLDPANTVLFAEVFIDFISSQARSAITTRLPRAHQGYLRGVFENLDPDAFPGIAYTGEELFTPDSERVFQEGLSMLMDAFELRRAKLI